MSTLSRRQVLAAAGVAGAAAVVGGALAGCDSEESGGNLDDKRAGAMEKYAVGDQFKATEPITLPIMLLSNAAYPYKKEWLFFSELTKRTNVTLEPTVIPGSDYNQKRSVMISAGDAPAIIPKTYHPDEEQYIAGGAILPVSDYLDYMPHFKDKIAKWNLNGDLDQWRQADGKFYLLPGVHEDVWIDYSLAVRTDIMTKLGIATPQTWDDVAAMLRTMRAAYPDNYPFSDRWSTPPNPGANNLLSITSQNYGTWAGWAWLPAQWDPATSKFAYTGATEQYKQVLTYLNGLVKEKLLDPESFTQTDDNARQKFASGKSFVISCNAQTLVNEARKDIEKLAGATVIKIPQPMGPLGAVKQGTRLENGIMISAKARDSKNFVAMLQFIDWLWYSDEGQMFAKWGVQGTTYTGGYATNDFKLNPEITWAGINAGAPKSLQVEYGFANGVFAYGGSTQHLESQFSPEEKEFQKVMTARRTLPQPPRTRSTPTSVSRPPCGRRASRTT
ncbi:extracellular solute-binding protein [Luedemannella flava]